MVKALIIDFGGTLDTNGNHWSRVMWKAYLQNGVLDEAQAEDFRKAYVYAERTLGNGSIIRGNYTFKLTLDVKLRLQLEYLITHGLLAVKEKTIFQDIHTLLHKQLYADMQQTVQKSREVLTTIVPHFPTVLVTNFYGNMRMVLREFNLEGLFSHVVESAEVGMRKPDPAIFQIAVDRLALSPQDILAVGDSMKNDILPAKHCGCQTCWLKGEGWDDVSELSPDHIITDIQQLKDVVLS